MKRLLSKGAAAAAILGLASATVLARPILPRRWPAANAAAPTGNVQALFESAPLVPAAPLWAYSAQRGGLRTNHSGQLDAAGRLLTFRPTYPFQAGEVVYATTCMARTANQPARPVQWQFTVAAGGTGKGNFLPGADLPTLTPAPGVVLGDVDNDGDLDLLTASPAASQVRVRLNGGDATGAGAGQYDAGTLVEVNYPAYSLALGDVDGDGDLDLLTGSDSYGAVSVRLNGGDNSGSGTGRFRGGTEITLGGAPRVGWWLGNAGKEVNKPGSNAAPPLSLVLGDVDNDGDLDLLTASNSGTGLVRVHLNGGDDSGSNTGVFSNEQQIAVGSNPYGLALGDVDDDGDLDLLTANWGGTVSVRLNGGDASGSGSGHFSQGLEVAVGPGTVSLVLGDIDGDGDLDLLTTSFTTSTVSVRLNGGDASGSNPGHFGAGTEVPVGARPQHLALADIDGDGDLDLLATCTDADAVSVRLNGGDDSGSGTGRFRGGSDLAMGVAPVGLALADVDGDGDLDLLTTSPTAGRVCLRLNQPWFLPVVIKLANPPGAATALAPGLLVQAYPNPAAQLQTLTIRTNQSGPATLLLADALGRQVSQQQLALSPGATTLPLTTASDLAAGVYVLRVQQGSQQQTIRLVRH